MKQVRAILKPYGYQPWQSYSEETQKALKSVLWGNPQEYFDYEKSPFIDFHGLIRIDKLFTYYLEKGYDITPFISVADWCQDAFSRSKLLSRLIVESKGYYPRTQTRLFNLNNAILILENFLLYTKNSFERIGEIQQTFHEVLPDFCCIMIDSYNYHNFNNNIPQREQAFQLFEKIFDENQKIYDDSQYFSRICLDFISKTLQHQKTITLEHPILKKTIPIFESYGSDYLKDFFWIKNKFLSCISLYTDSFAIVEKIIAKMDKNLVLDCLKKELQHDNNEYFDKIVYLLSKRWPDIPKEQSSEYINLLFKDISQSKEQALSVIKNLKPIFNVVTLVQEQQILEILEGKFTRNIKNEDFYKECINSLKTKIVYHQLQDSTPQKLPKKEIKKI